MNEFKFNPVDYGFQWTDDWYEYTADAETKAKKARDDFAKEQKKLGKTVKKRSSRNNLITMGGIGSGHPEISLVVPIYRVLVV